MTFFTGRSLLWSSHFFRTFSWIFDFKPSVIGFATTAWSIFFIIILFHNLSIRICWFRNCFFEYTVQFCFLNILKLKFFMILELSTIEIRSAQGLWIFPLQWVVHFPNILTIINSGRNVFSLYARILAHLRFNSENVSDFHFVFQDKIGFTMLILHEVALLVFVFVFNSYGEYPCIKKIQ